MLAGLFSAAGPNLAQQSGELDRYQFALTGDLPYDPVQEQKFEQLLLEINRAQLEFVVHDGDFKGGSTPCTDEVFIQRLNLLQQFVHPLIYIPGDNEWTDCHREGAGQFDPLERLAKIRELFFPVTDGDQTLGQRTLTVERQSENSSFQKYRENVIWHHGDVTYAGIHIVGSNNNLGRNAENDAEYEERNEANLAWLAKAFDEAEDSRALMIVIHANPGFNVTPEERTGFNDFIDLLQTETIAYGNPVVLVHGDSHYFRIDKPLNLPDENIDMDNFTRVETFGSPNVNWLRVVVNPDNPQVFEFFPEYISD
ncbi:MAG: metallophosphoesterase [Cyanobacteria bacterium P01_D01_bin.56]